MNIYTARLEYYTGIKLLLFLKKRRIRKLFFLPKKNWKKIQSKGKPQRVCVLECPQQTEHPNQDKNAKVSWKCHQIEQVQKWHILQCSPILLQPSSLVPKREESSGLQASTNSKQFYFWSKWSQFASFFNMWAKKGWHLKKDSVWLRGDGANGRKILLRKSKITWSWRGDTCALAALDFS